MGWLAAGAEEILNGAVQIVNDDWGWETELDKANSADHDFEREKSQLELLQAIAENLKSKLEQWSKDNIIRFF